ncbi:hypothetical protein ACFLVR_01915 [Chloroflexota bacterium]
MASALTSSHLRILVLLMLTAIVLVDIGMSIYHFNTGGIPSGITESILAFVIPLSWYLTYTAQQYEPASNDYIACRITGLSLIVIAAIILLAFGIYHFGTPTGTRSGAIETSLAFFLIVLDVLLYKAYKRPTGT